jgi:MFS superfamily sulfate permease-like transporter
MDKNFVTSKEWRFGLILLTTFFLFNLFKLAEINPLFSLVPLAASAGVLIILAYKSGKRSFFKSSKFKLWYNLTMGVLVLLSLIFIIKTW